MTSYMRKLDPRLALERKEGMKCCPVVLGSDPRWREALFIKGRGAKRQVLSVSSALTLCRASGRLFTLWTSTVSCVQWGQ